MKIKEIPLCLGILSVVLLFFFKFFLRLDSSDFFITLELFAYICVSLLMSILILQVSNFIIFKKIVINSTNRHITFIVAIILQAIFLLKILQAPLNATYDIGGVLFFVTATSTAICYLVLSAISLYKEKIKK